VLLTCEHAGDLLPEGYAWGTDARLQGTHWCVDIGIRGVCLEVQAALGCPAVLARYSRLFADCNRPLPVKAAAVPAGMGQGGASAAYLTSPFCAEAEGQPIGASLRRLCGAPLPTALLLWSLAVPCLSPPMLSFWPRRHLTDFHLAPA
jgi:hypothetical protein